MIRALALLPLLATPALSQEACTSWTAGMMDDEGGQVFTAEACAIDRPDAYLVLNCFGGEIFMRYDLAMGAERSPDQSEERDVVFRFADGEERLHMLYQDMDGMFAGDLAADAPLIDRLRSGAEVRITDADGVYPIHTIGLDGSSAALYQLLAQCD